MRTFIAPILVTTALLACGGVDDAPLGGPYGGTTDTTDPNGGQNGNNGNNGNTGDTDSGTTQTQNKDAGQQQQQKDAGQQQQQKDSGTTQTQDAGQQQQNTAPTWTTIFNAYLAGSKEGRCSQCHSQGSSAKNLYSWLAGKGYIGGTSSALVDNNQSCLSWYGGNMPPSGPSDAKAVSDMNAWAAAGAQNN